MSIPTVAVTCVARDQNGNPVAGGIFKARLNRTEIYQGFVVPEQVSGVADANGVCVLQLWPNELGANASSYRITATNPDTKQTYLNTTAVVPNSACLLHEIIVVPPFPDVSASEQALIAAQSALADVTAQALAASASASSASASASSAASSATDAASSATSAGASATTATNKAAEASSSATSAANSASAANTSAASAGASETAASSSAAAALVSETAAAASAATASLQASLATTSASESSAFASAAAGSASDAAADAMAAQSAKTSAESSAASAATSASTASTNAATAVSAASAAAISANAATAAKDAALASQTAAAASAASAAAAELQTGLDAVATAADRVQTGLDAAATAADRVQTGIDAASADADATAAAASAAAANTSAGQAAGSAAQALAIYGNTAAVQTAVAQAAAQASLAQGYAASASSVVQQDLSGVNAAALHRSPNAVTALFVYDTSKDSDGGAWTEKCQHTSWYNEDINGKWLGAAASEFEARNAFATLGAELVTNGDFSNGTTGWVAQSGITLSIDSGRLKVTTDGTLSTGTQQAISGLVVGKTYVLTWEFTQGNRATNNAFVAAFAGMPGFGGFTASGAYRQVFTATATSGTFVIRNAGSTQQAGDFWLVDNISVREVTAVTTQTGDYFQLTTDGKFYKLNATSGTTEVFRGNKRDFPRLAGIVAEAANVTIYDLTEPGRPMWMRFFHNGSNVYQYIIASNVQVNSIAATNGGLILSESGQGLVSINFSTDGALNYRTTGLFQFYQNIANRNISQSGQRLVDASRTIANMTTNAVAMTVLPDAPVDPVTGLKVPTIAVATGGGVSVIKHNGTVVNSSEVINSNQITLNPNILTVGGGNAGRTWRYAINPGTLGASFVFTGFIFQGGSSEWQRGIGSNFLRTSSRSGLAKTDNANLLMFRRNNETSDSRAAHATITNTYNTGHQPGDIRRTYLSDNVVESVGPSTELVPNWDFSSTDVSYITRGSGSVNGTYEVVGGQLVYTHGSSDLTNPTIVIPVTGLTVGKTYYFSQGTRSGTMADRRTYIGTGANGSGGTSYLINTATSGFFVAIQSTVYIGLFANGSTAGQTYIADNISIKEAVTDRSYKAQAANITGTLTKSAVASAAELVAYSGFSASNYLREPYSADLDFAQGEWSVGAWVNVPVSLPVSSFPVVGSELVDTLNTAAAWGVYGTNTVTDDAGAVKVTYVDSASGAFAYIRASGGLSSNLTTGRAYRVTGNAKVSSGSVNVSVPVTVSTVATITSTDFVPFSVYFVATSATGDFLRADSMGSGETIWVKDLSVVEIGASRIADRAHTSGARIGLGIDAGGKLTATAFDGTTTRTVTTTAAYNTATWAKAEACYTTDGTLSIRVNGVEVAATRGNPLLTLNNSNAVLTIGNSYATDAPFPGSIALLKLSATVPTAEQSQWMYEQEKQLFRANAKCCLPDSGSILDLTYDDATDKWIAISATNESEWSGLVRTSVTAVPAGSYSKASAASGVQLLARTTTSPGVDITIPAYGLREELVKRAEAAARLNAQPATFDYVGGFTATTVTGNTAITSVAGLTYPTSYIGARVSGSGIPANTTVVAVSGTTIYLSAAATASASNVQISFVDYALPVGYEAKEVSLAGAAQREGSTSQFVRLFDGFKETIRFGTAPAYNSLIQIQAVRGAA